MAALLHKAELVEGVRGGCGAGEPVVAGVGDQRGGGGDHHYDAPSGWLFGVKPGEKYEKEGWENVTFYVFIPMMVLFVGVYAFKPDTR